MGTTHQDVAASLARILERAGKKRDHAAIRTLLEPIARKFPEGVRLDQLVDVLKLGCESKSSTIIATALECFQLLILGGWFSGGEDRPSAPGGHDAKGSANSYAVHTFVDCVTVLYNYPSFAIQRSVVQCLSLAVVSPKCGLNGDVLLSAFRTTYNVALMSRSENVQKEARDAITRMLGVILDHLEEAALATPTGNEPPTPAAASGRAHSSNAPPSEPSSASHTDGPTSIATDHTRATSSSPPLGNHAPRERSESGIPPDRTANPLRPRTADSRGVADGTPPGRANGPDPPSCTAQENFVLVTRSLSRLSRRVIGDSPQADSVLVQSRVYAVELLCILFAGFGRRHPPPPATPMIADMRSYALECILTNICTTAPTSLFAMSISIFRSVIANVRRVCKHQVTVVFTRVVLPILTLPSSSFGQKVAILQLLQAICADSKVLVEVFLNNDCDKRCIALFENIVAALRRTVLTNHVEKQWITAQQSAILQHYALQALVSVLRSLAAALPAMEAVETPPALLYQLRLVRGRMVWNSQGWKKGYPWLKANEPDIPVHEFLRFAPSLSATEIGGFFSPKKEEHMKAFEAYLSYFDFSNKQLDMALRELMMAFRMAGESQIIDRLFGLFAKKYNADNGSPFTDDGAYFLSFATMMLHTQKHNPNAELSMRMTKENFISYQAGQNGGSDFSPELLSDIYDRISRFEIKIEHDTDPSPPPQDIELEESLTQSNGEREKEREKERELERGLELGTGVFLPHTKVKQLRFIQDARALVKKATHYLRRYCHPYDYVEVCGAEAVGLMFSLAWPHILAGVQYTMQRADEHPVLALCYEALALASDLGVRFGVDSEELSLIAHQLTPAPDSRLPGPFPLTLTTFDINAF